MSIRDDNGKENRFIVSDKFLFLNIVYIHGDHIGTNIIDLEKAYKYIKTFIKSHLDLDFE